MKTKPRLPFTEETIDRLARQLADYRIGGCRDGAAQAVMAATRKTAAKHGQSYGELWALVHAATYRIVDEIHASRSAS